MYLLFEMRICKKEANLLTDKRQKCQFVGLLLRLMKRVFILELLALNSSTSSLQLRPSAYRLIMMPL